MVLSSVHGNGHTCLRTVAMSLTIASAAVVSLRFVMPAPTNTDSEDSLIAAKLGLKAGSVFADVGSNDGFWAEKYLAFVRPGGRGYVTDVGGQLAMLRDRASKLDPGELTVRNLLDANRGLPADGSIDGITMRMSFHYEHNPSSAPASYFRALRPGGRLMIMEHPGCEQANADDSPSLATFSNRNHDGDMSPLGVGHMLSYPPVRLTFEAVGFEVREHGDWDGFMFSPCSWYAVFQKPVA